MVRGLRFELLDFFLMPFDGTDGGVCDTTIFQLTADSYPISRGIRRAFPPILLL
jgi:hypothetical protein